MARSQYYGSRGSEVRETQVKLNEAGANLNVDGVWGPKTEAAYQQYMQGGVTAVSQDPIAAYRQAGLAVPEGVALRQAPVMDEEGIRQEAEARYNPYYDSAADKLEAYYANAMAEAADSAIARGMARSTYFDELQNSLRSGQAAALGENERHRAAQIAAAIAEIRRQSREQMQQVEEYNNKLLLELFAMDQDRLAQEQKNMAVSSGGGKRRKKSTEQEDEEKKTTSTPRAASQSHNTQLGGWGVAADSSGLRNQTNSWLAAYTY